MDRNYKNSNIEGIEGWLKDLTRNHAKTYRTLNILIASVVILFLAVIGQIFYIRFSKANVTSFWDKIDISNESEIIKILQANIKSIDDRYTTFVTEVAIWIAALVGVMTVLTILIEYIYKTRAKEEYNELSNLIESEKEQMLKKISERETEMRQLQSWVEFYNACTGLQALHSSIRISTPMLKHLLSDMFQETVNIKEQLLKLDSKRCSLAYLTLYRTLDYIYPLLIGEYVELKIQHITCLRDNLYRLILLQKLEVDATDEQIELERMNHMEKAAEKSIEVKKTKQEIEILVPLVMNQIEMLASILKTEAKSDIQKCQSKCSC